MMRVVVLKVFNKLFILGLVFILLISCVSFVSANLTTGLEAYWKFDGDALDSVNSFDGTVTGATNNLAYGKINEGYDFSGSSQYINLGDISTSLNAYTLCAWFNADDVTNPNILFSNAGTGENTGFKILIYNNLLYFTHYEPTQKSQSTAFTDTTSWHQACIIWNGTVVKGYLDNVEKTSIASTVNAESDYARIGARALATPDQFFNGQIDEIYFSTRAINLTERTELYNSGEGKQYPFTTPSSNIPTTSTDITGFPTHLYVGDTLEINATGSTDADNDTITYYYEFYNVDDTTIKQAYSTTNTYTILTTDAHDTITVRTKAFDGTNYSGVYSENDIVENSQPMNFVLNTSTNTPEFDPNIGININYYLAYNVYNATDADNDTITYEYAIINTNESNTRQYNSSEIYYPTENDIGDELRIIAYIRDGYGTYQTLDAYYNVSGYKYNITVKDYYTDNSINIFGINITGTETNTTDGDLWLEDITENINITVFKNNYFNNITTINSDTEIVLVPYTEIYAESYEGTPITNFNVTYNSNIYETNTGVVYIPLYNETEEVSAGQLNVYATDTQNLTASNYLQNYTFSLYYYNMIELNIFDFNTKNLITDKIDINTISDIEILKNSTTTGNITLKFLAPNEYELRFNSTNYDITSLFLKVTEDSTNFLKVYLQDNNTELQTVIVKDSTNNELEGAIVRVQREYLGDSLEWLTVGEYETNFNGETSILIERDTNIYYRFAIIYDNELRPILPTKNLYTTKTFFVPDINEDIEIVVDTQDISQIINIGDWLGVQGDLIKSLDNQSINFTWYDASNTITGGKLKVYGKFLLQNNTYELLSTQTSDNVDGLLNYNFPITNNTIYRVEGYVVINDKDYLIDQEIINFESEITLPSTILTFSSLFLCSYFNLVSLSQSFITSLIAFAVILYVRFRKNE
jgi:hypothetical protein